MVCYDSTCGLTDMLVATVASGVPSLELNSVLATAVPIPSPEVTSGQLSLTEDDATPTFV